MQGNLLIIKRQCKEHTTHNDEGATLTDIHHGPWILEPENDPNSIETPLDEADIYPLLDPIADPYHRAAEPSLLVFLTRLLEQDRFQATTQAGKKWDAW